MVQALEFQQPFYAASEFPFNDGIVKNYLQPEEESVQQLLDYYLPSQAKLEQIRACGEELIEAAKNHHGIRIETFLKEYGLDNHEGIILMCLAEALFLIPDNATAERFLLDKLKDANWAQHLGHSDTFWVNFSTWGLALTGKIINKAPLNQKSNWLRDQIKQLVKRLGEPLALSAVRQAMAVVGQQFVSGQTITDAIQNNLIASEKGYFHSYDMLGEAALTQQDVGRYMGAYTSCILGIAQAQGGNLQFASMSIKLSALHPRFELKQRKGMIKLKENLRELLSLAHEHNVAITLDAEESWRLEPMLTLFAEIMGSEPFRHWGRLGIAVQAYQKRAPAVLDWLMSLSKSIHCQIPVRLVKGAYWDSEIKHAQILGLDEYPVFTSKSHTDLCYLACANKLIHEKHFLYPQFATHNAHTVASILMLAQEKHFTQFEFQRLHGMGEALYDYLLETYDETKCRVYSPVGDYRELLPYLVRRLLENGANTSFVRLLNQDVDNSYMLEEPSLSIKNAERLRNTSIPLPARLFSPERKNSRGLNLESSHCLKQLKKDIKPFLAKCWDFSQLQPVSEEEATEQIAIITSPANTQDVVGRIQIASQYECHCAMDKSLKAFEQWRLSDADDRADMLNKVANLLEDNAIEFMALAMREAGKSLSNAMGEIREAVDFCRYYAIQARKLLSEKIELPGPTGEQNTLHLEGRGVVLCISPWNFPLAIFTGQVAAALAAGNTVLAKPSTSTALIATRAIHLFHEAGFPKDVLQLLTASAKSLQKTLLNEPHLGAVMFTGSTSAARKINRLLAQRDAPIIPFIAETGGQNAMIIDSSALPEQVVKDAALSAFDSAGQRCSALRVLFVQEDIKPKVLELLKGYMAELQVGGPIAWDTDIGPVINSHAKSQLETHIQRFRAKDQVLFQAELAPYCNKGSYVAPTLIELENLNELYDEVFGPVLHVISYDPEDIDAVIDQINATGFGLTLGVHSRITSFCEYVASKVKVGNVYINRNMIGATVGVQPFGGQGLSGTGPKAGGPHYLLRLVTEKSISINTAAIGGNTTLLTDY